MSANNQDEKPVIMKAIQTARNVNEVHEERSTIGQRIADQVTTNIGSWHFVLIFSIIMAAWILWNVTPSLIQFDPPPFILLNLCLSFIAGYTGPFVMMSQNRQAAKDRLTADNDYQSDMRSETLTREIKHDMASLRVDTKLKFSDQTSRLMQISRNVAEQDTAIEGLEMQLNSIELHVKEMHKILEQWNNDRDTGEMEKVKA